MTHNQRLGKATSKFLLGRNLFYFYLNPNLHSHNSHTGSLISNYIYYFLLVFERGFGSVEGEEGKLHFLTLTCPKLPTPLRRKVPTNNSLCRHSQLYFCLFKSGTKKGRMVTCASKAAIIYEAAWSLSGLPSSRFSSLCNYWQKNVFLIFVRRNTVFSIPAAIVQCCQKTGDWWLKRDAKSDLIITYISPICKATIPSLA